MAKGPESEPGDSSAADAPPRVEGFLVSELLGTGGYSRVYRARQIGFDRAVALKVLSVGIETDDQQRRFERECRAMGVLSQHPNIVTVFNAAMTATRQPCIAMELYSGGTVGDLVRNSGPLGLGDVLEIGVTIAGALQTAHDRGVVHRDIKPQNIFVSEYGQPALGDFGISSFDDDRTITGGGGLTVHYAPPELIEGEPATAASDVYSLAASLFTLATGQRPFRRHDGQTLGELARQILVQPAPRLDGPVELADLLEEAMAKSPFERPATAAEFGMRLRAIQRALGMAETEMVTASMATESSGSSSAGDLDDSETIVSAANGGVVDMGSTPGKVSQDADRGRRIRRGLVPAGMLAAAVVLATALFAGSPESELASEEVTASTIDDFFSAPAVPSGVAIERAPNATSAVVSWNRSTEVRSYQVELLDTGTIVETIEAEAIVELAKDAPVCVTVTAVGLDGRLSPPTRAVCSG